jgi:hypothetical protein
MPRIVILGCAGTGKTTLARELGKKTGAGEAHQMRHLPRVLRFISSFDRINRPRIDALRKLHGARVPVLQLTGPTLAPLAASKLMNTDS